MILTKIVLTFWDEQRTNPYFVFVFRKIQSKMSVAQKFVLIYYCEEDH